MKGSKGRGFIRMWYQHRSYLACIRGLRWVLGKLDHENQTPVAGHWVENLDEKHVLYNTFVSDISEWSLKFSDKIPYYLCNLLIFLVVMLGLRVSRPRFQCSIWDLWHIISHQLFHLQSEDCIRTYCNLVVLAY